MASRKGGVSLPDKQRLIKGKDEGIVGKITSSISESAIVEKAKHVACEATDVVKKLSKSTGRAMWISGTYLLILVVPLIIEMDREQQLNELELQQASLLGTPPVGGK
uniref:Uncharacterized protein n=1 Tax=Kalanchoe fedtschenkoi TaxID=63787 RepID=A0A7N0U578_KALFE